MVRRTQIGARGSAALVALVGLAACRSGSNVAPPVATPPAAIDGAPSGLGGAMTVHVLLDDPRLATARGLERAKDWAGAASAVHEARPPELPPSEACTWDFLEGRLLVLANKTAEALAEFEHADRPECVLAGHARLRSAQALARSGRADDAIARAHAVPEDHTSLADDVKMVVAESLAAKGDRAGALPLWRAWLAANPHGSRWVDTSVRIANALMDGIDGPPESHAREAYEAATRVVVEAPKLADSSGARDARARAVTVLRAKEPATLDALNDAERARQAQAWLEANEPQRAFDLAASVATKTSPAACRAAITRANAGAKKVPKADAWSEAVSACEKDGDLVNALYGGAKARTGKDPKLAIEWFGRVEELFPSHRLADDARFRAALLVAQGTEAGHEERAEQMLRTLPEAYPSGDMRAEALFRVALARMQKGRVEDWAVVKELTDRILEIVPDDRHWATAGRAEYFRARAALATGDVEGALARFGHVVTTNPLSYYMLLAQARLKEADAARVERVVSEAIAKDRAGGPDDHDAGVSAGLLGSRRVRPHPILDSAAFLRAIRLLEVSDVDAARREFASAGATSEGVDAEVLWTVGAIYNQAGWPDLGHAFSRGRVSDHLGHWPEGRWRAEWETAYPRAFEPLVDKACEKYGLPRPIAWGIMREESSFVADAKSPANAYGLMQLIVPTARGIASGTGWGSDEVSLKRPEVSIELGTKLLAALRTQQPHPALAIGAYNGGGGAMSRWYGARTSDELDLFVENVPWEETRNYVKRVLSSVAAYGYLYDRKAYEDTLALPLRFGR
jgi:soluble lytic murein transglycosylase